MRAVERCKSPRDRAIAVLLVNTGLRIGECAALDVWTAARRKQLDGDAEQALFVSRKGARLSTLDVARLTTR